MIIDSACGSFPHSFKKTPVEPNELRFAKDVEPNVRITRDVFESLASMLCASVSNCSAGVQSIKVGLYLKL